MTLFSRTLVATSVVVMAVLALGFPASAGGSVPMSVDATCNLETGEYDVVFRLDNTLDEPGTIEIQTFDVDGVPTVPEPVFAPDILFPFAASSATIGVPGTTTVVFLALQVDYPISGNWSSQGGMELDGDCVADPTTTTTDGETTTTTEAAAAEAVRLQPAFTG
jgi:hypothetical protein